MSKSPAQSSRGLFRATGKKPKPVPVRFEDGEFGAVDALPRERHDFYPTPPEPTMALAHAERDRLAAFPALWEPCCGDGAMVRDLASLGHRVIGSDLIDRGAGGSITIRDFFAFDAALAPAIVTNPPYNLVNWRDGQGRFIVHAVENLDVEYMALLLSWSWPGAGGLGALWERHGPARVYLMRWKIDFTGQGAPPMLNGWFVWDRAHKGETVLRMLDRTDAARAGQGVML